MLVRVAFIYPYVLSTLHILSYKVDVKIAIFQ